MNMKRFALIICAAVQFFAVFATTKISVLREEMTAASEQRILQSFSVGISLNDLGDWRDAIENSLYLVLRKTDVTRGAIKILVADTGDFLIGLDACGVFVISTGVLDFIDDTLFSLIGTSSRRIKNMTSERESLLIPLAAVAVAHYTLDHQYTNYIANRLIPETGAKQQVLPLFTESQHFEADRFACILLNLIGFHSDSLHNVLSLFESAINRNQSSDSKWYYFSAYLQDVPLPSRRIAELTRVESALNTVIADVTLATSNIRKGIGLKESIDTMRAVQQIYPDAICFERYIAQGMQKQWFSVRQPIVGFKDLYAIGTYRITETTVKASAVSDSLFRDIDVAYCKLLEKQYDPYVASDYAWLLATSPDLELREKSLTIAELAATGEQCCGTISRRVNYASVLYILGNQNRAKSLLQQLLYPNFFTGTPDPLCLPNPTKATAGTGFLFSGFVGSLDDAIDNYRIMNMKNSMVVPEPPLVTDNDMMVLRGVKIADTMDTLVSRWGKPDEIVYDYYTESWIYHNLQAVVTLANGAVSRIEVTYPSPASLPGDIRPGDRREDFEKNYGSAVSRAYDYDVYKSGSRYLYVSYMSGKIRSITVQ